VVGKPAGDRVAARSPAPPAAQLNTFLARYAPGVRRTARAALAGLRRRLPGATELVYDNYNALVVGFGPTDRASDAVFSIAVYPRWVTLFFLQDGPDIPDPEGLLKGSGSRVRHLVLDAAAEDLNRPAVRRLITAALGLAPWRVDGQARRRLIIKSVSPKQRPRRPPAARRSA
jgi:hypothetical protein